MSQDLHSDAFQILICERERTHRVIEVKAHMLVKRSSIADIKCFVAISLLSIFFQNFLRVE